LANSISKSAFFGAAEHTGEWSKTHAAFCSGFSSFRGGPPSLSAAAASKLETEFTF
jgi:hypothetical protein